MVSPNLKNNLPNTLTQEELLKILKEDPSEIKEEDNQTDDILGFVSFFNLKPGKNLVPKKLIYQLYQYWSKAPISSNNFFNKFTLYFQPTGYGHRTSFYLNLESINISKRLLKLIDKHTRIKTKSPTYKRHFESFLNHYKLKAGKIWIESYILYYLYDKWTYKIKKKHPLSKEQFYNFCKLYFPKNRITTSSVLFYQVDDIIYKIITRKEVEEIRKGVRDKNKKEKNKA